MIQESPGHALTGVFTWTAARLNGTKSGPMEPHEASPELLEKTALIIVTAEGPIHEDEVARRVAACFGKERAGARIAAGGESGS